MEKTDIKGLAASSALAFAPSVGLGAVNLWLATSSPTQLSWSWMMGWLSVPVASALCMYASVRSSHPLHISASALTIAHVMIRYLEAAYNLDVLQAQQLGLLQFTIVLFLAEAGALRIEIQREHPARKGAPWLTIEPSGAAAYMSRRILDIALLLSLGCASGLLLATISGMVPIFLTSIYAAILGSTALIVILVLLVTEGHR